MVVQGSKVVVIQYLTLERRTCQTVKNLYVIDQVERLRTLATLHDAEPLEPALRYRDPAEAGALKDSTHRQPMLK